MHIMVRQLEGQALKRLAGFEELTSAVDDPTPNSDASSGSLRYQ